MSLDDFLAAIPERCASASFLAFCEEIGVELTEPQETLCAVAFDGQPPLGRFAGPELFGEAYRSGFPKEALQVLVAVCGARAGKSYVLGALRMLHLALTVPLTTLAPGEVAVALIVAPDVRLGRQVLRYAHGAATDSLSIARRIVSSTADGFLLKRPDGHVSIEVLPATRGGSALRGRSLVGAVLDECAFFRDASYQVNDVELYRAVGPRIMQGGQLIIASTPWAEVGLLWEFHQRNHGHPVDAVSVHAPTLLLRDDEHTRSYVAREQARDPANAAREFGAEFMGSAGNAFFEGEAITAAIDQRLELPAEPHSVPSVGADFGFRSDSSALVTARRCVEPLQRIDITRVIEVRPEPKKPLKPSVVVAGFAKAASEDGADSIIADAHYRQSIAEHLEVAGLALMSAPEGANGKAETYQAVRALLREGRVRLPNHERLIRQLREVTARPSAGGGITIDSPRWRTGGHGDLVSAFVLAVWDAARGLPVEAPPEYAAPVDEVAARWEASIREDQERYADEAREDAWREFG